MLVSFIFVLLNPVLGISTLKLIRAAGLEGREPISMFYPTFVYVNTRQHWTWFCVPWFIMIIYKSVRTECVAYSRWWIRKLVFRCWLALWQNLIIEGQVLSCACVSDHRHSRSRLWLNFLLAFKSCCSKQSWTNVLKLCLALSQTEVLNRPMVWGCYIWNASSSYKTGK